VISARPRGNQSGRAHQHNSKRFRGFSRADFERLFGPLQSRVTRLQNTVRWRVAIWDNRARQHHAVDDYGDQAREVRRVTVAGEAPVSVTGALSSSVRRRPRPPGRRGRLKDLLLGCGMRLPHRLSPDRRSQ